MAEGLPRSTRRVVVKPAWYSLHDLPPVQHFRQHDQATKQEFYSPREFAGVKTVVLKRDGMACEYPVSAG